MLGYSESTRRPACRGGIYGQRSSSCEFTEAKETARVLPAPPSWPQLKSFVEVRTVRKELEVHRTHGRTRAHRITQTNKCPGTKPNSSGTKDCEMLLMLGFLKGIRILSHV